MLRGIAVQEPQGWSEVASQVKAVDREPTHAELHTCAVRCIEADARAADPHNSGAILALAHVPQAPRVWTIPIHKRKLRALHAA